MSNVDFTARRKSIFDKIGVRFDKFWTQEQYMKECGLDFTVIKAPLYAKCYETIDGEPISMVRDAPGTRFKRMQQSYALLRNDNGYMFTEKGRGVSEVYSVYQNAEMFNFCEHIFMRSDVEYDRAGSFDNGRRVFVTINLKDDINVFGNDITERYLLLTSTHDGNGSINIRFINTRVVCQNTLNLALKEDAKYAWSIRHTTNKDERIDQVKQIVSAMKYQKEELENKLLDYKRIQLTDKQLQALIGLVVFDTQAYVEFKANNFVLTSKFTSKVKSNFVKDYNILLNTTQLGVGQEYHRGTLLHAFNGVTCYVQNVKEYTNTERFFDNTLNNPLVTKFEKHLISNLTELNTIL